jgi:NAD(P)-dependent dehydrogenase (short-subunit alcohol dehydrogenase family)
VAQVARRSGANACAIIADALDERQVDRVIAETLAELGGLDILVTIVGASSLKGFLEAEMEDWDADHMRNVRYFVAYARAVARHWVKHACPGAIVATATGGALRSMPFRAGYGANKAALVNLVKSLAVELGEYGIRVNAVAPGATFTPNSVGYMDTPAFKAEVEKIPLGRLARPEDIGKSVLFLASDMAQHITGSVLAVDGGSFSAPLYDLRSSRVKSRRNVMANLGVKAEGAGS